MKLNIGDKIFANDVEIRGALTVSGSLLGPALDGYESNAEADSRWSEINQQTEALRNAADGYVSQDGYQNVIVQDLEINGQEYAPIPAVLAPTGVTQNISWDDGMYQILDLEDASGNVTLTFSEEHQGAAYILEVRQDSTTPRTVTLPGNCVFADGVEWVASTGANAVDLLSIIFNGSVFFVTASKNFS